MQKGTDPNRFPTGEGPPHSLRPRPAWVDRVLRRPADSSAGRTEDKAGQEIEKFPYYIVEEPLRSSTVLLRKA